MLTESRVSTELENYNKPSPVFHLDSSEISGLIQSWKTT